MREPVERLLAGEQGVRRTRHTPIRQRRQRSTAYFADATANHNPIVTAVMRLPAPTAVTNDRCLPAYRTPPRQPFTLRLIGLAFFAGTWDKDDHGCEGMPRNRHPPRHLTPRPRLRS